MRTDAYWLGVASGFVVVAIVIEMVRRRYLRGRFALIWLALGAGAVVLALFPGVLDAAARIAGVQVPLNLLLFLGTVGMLIMVMQLSAESGRLRERTRVLAEEIALLRTEIDTLRAPATGSPRSGSRASVPGAELRPSHGKKRRPAGIYTS